MATKTVELKNKKALSILEGMEKAGLISLALKKKRSKSLAQRLRFSITGLRAYHLSVINKSNFLDFNISHFTKKSSSDY